MWLILQLSGGGKTCCLPLNKGESPLIYNVKLDENGFVTDLTKISPAPAGYAPMEVGELPGDVICGYYRLVDGTFVLDELKKAKYDEENQAREPLPVI
jgi:hypothetical protein